jgi:hypothetical protein
MAATATIHVRVDEKVKERATALCLPCDRSRKAVSIGASGTEPQRCRGLSLRLSPRLPLEGFKIPEHGRQLFSETARFGDGLQLSVDGSFRARLLWRLRRGRKLLRRLLIG